MDSEEFAIFRKKLNKTQKQMASLLGVSIKAIHSYEQGWRSVPPHVERQMFFLMSRKRGVIRGQKPCWTVKKCPAKQKKECPAWEFQAGKFCWFINGTICCGKAHDKWKEKMKVCRSCEFLVSIMMIWPLPCNKYQTKTNRSMPDIHIRHWPGRDGKTMNTTTINTTGSREPFFIN